MLVGDVEGRDERVGVRLEHLVSRVELGQPRGGVIGEDETAARVLNGDAVVDPRHDRLETLQRGEGVSRAGRRPVGHALGSRAG